MNQSLTLSIKSFDRPNLLHSDRARSICLWYSILFLFALETISLIWRKLYETPRTRYPLPDQEVRRRQTLPSSMRMSYRYIWISKDSKRLYFMSPLLNNICRRWIVPCWSCHCGGEIETSNVGVTWYAISITTFGNHIPNLGYCRPIYSGISSSRRFCPRSMGSVRMLAKRSMCNKCNYCSGWCKPCRKRFSQS